MAGTLVSIFSNVYVCILVLIYQNYDILLCILSISSYIIPLPNLYIVLVMFLITVTEMHKRSKVRGWGIYFGSVGRVSADQEAEDQPRPTSSDSTNFSKWCHQP